MNLETNDTKIYVHETTMEVTTLGPAGEEVSYAIFAGSDRDGATLKIIGRDSKYYNASDGDFEDPLVAALWQAMGVVI